MFTFTTTQFLVVVKVLEALSCHYQHCVYFYYIPHSAHSLTHRQYEYCRWHNNALNRDVMGLDSSSSLTLTFAASHIVPNQQTQNYVRGFATTWYTATRLSLLMLCLTYLYLPCNTCRMLRSQVLQTYELPGISLYFRRNCCNSLFHCPG